MEIIKNVISTHPDKDKFLSLVDACHTITSQDSFMSEVYPTLKMLIPHERFICGTALVKLPSVQKVINVGFPQGYVKQMISADGKICSPMIRYWLSQKVHAPVFHDRCNNAILHTVADWAWKDKLTDNSILKLAAHGQLDVSGMAMSYFCFADASMECSDMNTMLRLVVPHLHIAVMQMNQNNSSSENLTLSVREKDVLQLVCHGKTNKEIACTLGISAWTVKIHVRNFMEKLDVSTRGHAVAKAMQYGFV